MILFKIGSAPNLAAMMTVRTDRTTGGESILEAGRR